MYPLTPELSAKIIEILNNEGIHYGQAEEMHDEIAALLVRENRRLRQRVLKLGRRFVKAVEEKEMSHGDSCAAYIGEDACRYIANKIIKPSVYIDKEETVDRLIQDFYYEDDDSER
jgi:hypothetical protein